MNEALALIDLVSLAGGAADAHVRAALQHEGFSGLRVRHGYVFQRLLVAPSSITALADDLGVTQQAMSKTIAELTSLGYITASVDAADARRRSLALSPRGLAAVRAARQARAALEQRITDAVGSTRVRAAREVLAALLDELDLTGRVDARTVPIPDLTD